MRGFEKHVGVRDGVGDCVVEEILYEKVRGLRASATVATNDHSNRPERGGRSIYKLGLGQSPFPVLQMGWLRDHGTCPTPP